MIKGAVLFLLMVSGVYAWPTSVDQANGQLAERRRNIVKAWVAKYQYDWMKDPGLDNGSSTDIIKQATGFDHWLASGGGRTLFPENAVRKMAAGIYVFSHPSEFSDIEFTRLSYKLLGNQTFDQRLAEWKQNLLAHLQDVH